jgi:hypothetical protein
VTRTGGPQPFFHNLLDERRSMWRATPEAQYPDGYLGTLNSRRADRLMNNLIDRSRNRPYTRGVHKGERIDGRDYFWPEEFNPMTGLELEAMGEKYAPPGLGMEWDANPLWDNPTVGLRGVPRARTVSWGPVDPATREGLLRQAPPWSTGRPSMVTPYQGVGRM